MIRLAFPADADAVRGVVLAAYMRYVPGIGVAPAPMLDDYDARIAARQAWVLQDGPTVVGVLVLEDRPDCFLLDNVAVAPDQQGRGFGRQLLDFAEAEAARRGQQVVTLYTNVSMTENIAIYTARGYVERERRREKGFDRVYMEKRLD